jgi:lipoate-protein ligase A
MWERPWRRDRLLFTSHRSPITPLVKYGSGRAAKFRGAHAPSRAAIGALADRCQRNVEDFCEASNVRAGLAYARERARAPQMCFSNPVRADVLLNGQKIAGAAQRRTRRGLLQQGSIQNVDFGNGLAERFARALSRRIKTETIDHALIERGKKIAQEKYGSEAWLQKRYM